ncbi:MAG TPA: TldD/PmbA family protein [Chloroflexota bacterium]|nr:TldD/PmbA family protein [Chloroflexota bacterium]
MIGEPVVREIAETVLKTSTADQTEVLFWGTAQQLTRFANNTIHQNVAEEGAEVSVRVVFGKKIGVASGNRLDQAGLRDVVERATAVAKLQPDNPDFVSLPGPMAWERIDACHRATVDSTPDERATGVREVVERARARSLNAFGAFSTETTELAVANSLGVWVYQPRTVADLNAVVMSEAGSGYASAVYGDISRIDAASVGERAVDLCTRNRDQVEVEPGEYEVLLEPPAVAEMLDFLSFDGFNGLAVEEQRSPLCGKFGQQLVGTNVSIWDDGHDRRGLPLPFDFEGTPKRRVVFFDRGVVREAVYDSYTANKIGKISTGHALPAPNTYGPVPLNLVMANGDAASREEMLRGIKRGIWVTRFWYVNVLHPISMTLTGMTRDGTFLVENGQVVGAVKNLRFTQGVIEALNHVVTLSQDVSLQRSWMGSTLVPALHIGRFSFTGVTD